MLVYLQPLRTGGHLCTKLSKANRLIPTQNGYNLVAKHYASTASQPQQPQQDEFIIDAVDLKLVEYVEKNYRARDIKVHWYTVGRHFGLAPKECSKRYKESCKGAPTAPQPRKHELTDADDRKLVEFVEKNYRARDINVDWYTVGRHFGLASKECLKRYEESRKNDPMAQKPKVATKLFRRRKRAVVTHLTDLVPFLKEGVMDRVNESPLTNEQLSGQEILDKVLSVHREHLKFSSKLYDLYERLLCWRYEDSGEYPPDFDKSKLQKVQATYADCDTYRRVFDPLLMLEIWKRLQIGKANPEENSTGQAKFIYLLDQGELQYITFSISREDAEFLIEDDVIAITYIPSVKETLPGGREQQVQLADNTPISDAFFSKKTFLALVKRQDVYKSGARVVVRVYIRDALTISMLKALPRGACWEFSNIFSILPSRREYSALLSMEHLDENLVKEILSPHTSLHRPEPSRMEVQRVMEAHGLNQPQAEAVVSAIELENGFSLIQGPPGTGKTKTILGLAGELLSASKENADASGDEKSNAGPIAKKRLLICAFSNAAVDEIVRRLKTGIRDKSGATFYPRVVRIGKQDRIDSTVEDMSLHFLAEKALEALESKSAEEEEEEEEEMGVDGQQGSILPDNNGQNQSDHRTSVSEALSPDEQYQAVQASVGLLSWQLNTANSEVNELYAEKADVDSCDPDAVRIWKRKLQMAKQKRSRIAQRLAQDVLQEHELLRASGIDANLTAKGVAYKQILEEADIICTTLVGSGHRRAVIRSFSFETVIIDEAAQSTELASLIPLRYGCKRCILVGDPNQLPPIVTSMAATENLYGQSLFERIQKLEPQAVSTLNIQYRMHPEISTFPSRQFYESRLLNGPDMAVKQCAPWHENIKYRPFQFFNIYSGREQVAPSRSVYNMAEVTAAVQLVYNLCTDYPDLPWKHRIGVITSYKAQLEKLIEQFQSYFGDSITEAIEFNTVDGFQGQEKDVIIFSCVRASDGGVGFLKDQRRMNVGLTRARKSLFVLGNADRLVVSPPWKKFIDEAQDRWLLRKGSLPLFDNPAKRGDMPKGLLREVDEGSQPEFIPKVVNSAVPGMLSEKPVKQLLFCMAGRPAKQRGLDMFPCDGNTK